MYLIIVSSYFHTFLSLPPIESRYHEPSSLLIIKDSLGQYGNQAIDRWLWDKQSNGAETPLSSCLVH